jgi:hypothetical protein
MITSKRWLEINAQGIAFHEPGFSSPFSTGAQRPPREVIFCDCRGIGLICHHVYAGDPDAADPAARGDRHMHVHGAAVEELHRDAWVKKHRGPRCQHRRQIFVDVTDRPEAQLGMHYDEATDTFSPQKR